MRLNTVRKTGLGSRRGSALILVTIGLAAAASVSLCLVAVSTASSKEQRAARQSIGSVYVAEAGLSSAMFDLQTGGTGNLGEIADDAYSSNGNSSDTAIASGVDFGGSEYAVATTDLGGGLLSLFSAGTDGLSTARIELVVQETKTSIFSWGAFGDTQLVMDSNAMIDSYDSSLPESYADQAVNGSGANAHANSNGNAGSNGNIMMKQNTVINGNAVPGSSSTVTTTGTAKVTGSTTPSSNIQEMLPIELPDTITSGDLTVDADGSLAAGDYRFDNFILNASTSYTIHGPATIVFENFQIDSNSELWIDASGGPVEFFVISDFIMNRNTTVASLTYTPADVAFNLLSDNVIDPELTVDLDVVDLESNAELYGTIYAPNALIDINSNFELFGSLVAKKVHLDSYCRVHFDEALLNSNSEDETEYQIVGRRVVR